MCAFVLVFLSVGVCVCVFDACAKNHMSVRSGLLIFCTVCRQPPGAVTPGHASEHWASVGCL